MQLRQTGHWCVCPTRLVYIYRTLESHDSEQHRREDPAHYASRLTLGAIEMDGMKFFGVTSIISRASLIMCECSKWSSVSVGDAFRRNIRTLNRTECLILQGRLQRGSHVQSTRLESGANIINKANVADERKETITRVQGRVYANAGPMLLKLCPNCGLRQDLVNRYG
jgi:hypothetical protein